MALYQVSLKKIRCVKERSKPDMAHTSEYEVETLFIDSLEGIGYKFIKLENYEDVLSVSSLQSSMKRSWQKKGMPHRFQMRNSTVL